MRTLNWEDELGFASAEGANTGRRTTRFPGSDLPAGPDAPVARIGPAHRSVMQSGRAGTTGWILEFEPTRPSGRDFLTGWTMGEDPLVHVRMGFGDLQEAIAFAERQGWRYVVRERPARRLVPKSYLDRFR